MRLNPSTRVDRYQVSLLDGRLCFERALGGDQSLLGQNQPLFTVEGEGSDDDTADMSLKAVMDSQCVVVGSISSQTGYRASLLKNDAPVIHSQICTESGFGAHSFNGLVVLEGGDWLELKSLDNQSHLDHIRHCGHLAFLAL